jgi:hypothetical protein
MLRNSAYEKQSIPVVATRRAVQFLSEYWSEVLSQIVDSWNTYPCRRRSSLRATRLFHSTVQQWCTVGFERTPGVGVSTGGSPFLTS